MKILQGEFLLLLFILKGTSFSQPINNYKDHNFNKQIENFSYLRDTLYTLENNYLELNLTTQKGILHFRNGGIKNFGISSGTDKVEDGINTKEGLYVIQSKMPKWYSRQFDSTLMLDWMGFNYGVGFHALHSKGYYRFLGKRKSSHGCVRLSREVAKELYDTVEIGTPVLIHNGYCAVKIAFADSASDYKKYNYKSMYSLMKKYLRRLYTGRYFMESSPHVLIDWSNIGHAGIPIGDSRKVLQRQIIHSVYEFVSSSIPQPRYPVITNWKREKKIFWPVGKIFKLANAK